ncbi:hypothetical protein IFM89_014916 [Coptis chinensis]|uniref:Uncharacterized protein n=1 Tax=Coptis chinensis TaxID=261450 RepID=A0A835H389_9MAGN|nr:hypothetical protein IFM89_014916 [Coptis chinensis]
MPTIPPYILFPDPSAAGPPVITNWVATVAVTLVVWIEDNKGWEWGFGISTVTILLSIPIFLAGSTTYNNKIPTGSPLTTIAKVLECTVEDVEEVKVLVKILPIFACTIMFNCCLAQLSTFSVEQAVTMDTKVGSLKVPPASLPVFPILFIIILAPLYDHLIIPFARKATKTEMGISHLQRIGTGLVALRVLVSWFTDLFTLVGSWNSSSRGTCKNRVFGHGTAMGFIGNGVLPHFGSCFGSRQITGGPILAKKNHSLIVWSEIQDHIRRLGVVQKAGSILNSDWVLQKLRSSNTKEKARI